MRAYSASASRSPIDTSATGETHDQMNVLRTERQKMSSWTSAA